LTFGETWNKMKIKNFLFYKKKLHLLICVNGIDLFWVLSVSALIAF
jgi:hypothetical protein